MTRDPALRWLLTNDPAARSSKTTMGYLRVIGCDNAVKRYKTEFARPDTVLELQAHCHRCAGNHYAKAHSVA